MHSNKSCDARRVMFGRESRGIGDCVYDSFGTSLSEAIKDSSSSWIVWDFIAVNMWGGVPGSEAGKDASEVEGDNKGVDK